MAVKATIPSLRNAAFVRGGRQAVMLARVSDMYVPADRTSEMPSLSSAVWLGE